MRIVREPLKPEEIQALAEETFGDMIKVVVDLERDILAAGGALHADGEQLLLDDGSQQHDLWGANYYPGNAPGQRMVYRSVINQYHRTNKRSQEIQDPTIRRRVDAVVARYFGNV